ATLLIVKKYNLKGMKSKNTSIDDPKNGIDPDLENIDYMATKQELNLVFNKLTKNLMNQYEKYLKPSRGPTKNETENDESDEKELDSEDLSKKPKSSDLEIFLKYFDKLIEFVLTLKQENNLVLLGIFQKTNLVIIQLIEFLNKLLNILNQQNNFDERSNDYILADHDHTKSIESKVSIIGKTIQFLHVLTTNQSEDNNDDESTVYYCNLLTTSFNFTSSISYILVLNNSASEQKPFLTEQYSKACLDVLNNLTFDNRLFTIDTYIKKLIFQLVERITRSELRPNYFQFLSNILRNESSEVAKIFKSMDEAIIRRFYRQLISIIKDNTNGLVLLSLMILIKLEYSDLFSIVLPVKLKSNSDSTYEPIDCAMGALNDVKNQKKINSSLQKSNAINFLYEFVKCEPVRILLERNEGYTDVLLFRLNQFLAQSHSPSSQLPLNVSTKVIKLFDQLISSSDKLAKKQYQIIFDTKNFVESSSNNQCDLTSKLKDLALSNKRKSANGEYDYLIDYYLNIAEIKSDDLSDEDKLSHLTRNSSFYVVFYRHIFNLLKKNEKSEFDFKKSQKLIEIIVKNFYYLSSIYLDQNELNDSLLEVNMAKICFFNLASIDSLLRLFGKIDFNFESFAKALLDSIDQNIWQKSNESFDIELNNGNLLITCKLLMRLYLNKCIGPIKEKILALINDSRFYKATSYLITCSKEFSYRFLAYELLFDMEKLSTDFGIGRSAFLDGIVKSSLNLNSELRTTPINEFQYPVSNFEKTYESLQVQKRPYERKSHGDLDCLFDFYDFKLNEKMRQETYLINTLNQYFTNSLLKETEFKALRDQIKVYAQKELKYKKDLELIQSKKSEYEIKYKELSKSIADLEKENEQMKEIYVKLTQENEMFKEKCSQLEKDIEQAEKDNEETVESLQKMIEKETSLKKELQIKLKESHQKTSDLEQTNKTLETKRKELESKLDQIENELKDKNSLFDSMNKDYETLKSDHDKLKAILSYVKENYK
ncbi:unnamed protein product, partial [Brachionus calyciflorus]